MHNGFHTVQTVFLSAYLNPTPKPNPHSNLCAFFDFQKTNSESLLNYGDTEKKK